MILKFWKVLSTCFSIKVFIGLSRGCDIVHPPSLWKKIEERHLNLWKRISFSKFENISSDRSSAQLAHVIPVYIGLQANLLCCFIHPSSITLYNFQFQSCLKTSSYVKSFCLSILFIPSSQLLNIVVIKIKSMTVGGCCVRSIGVNWLCHELRDQEPVPAILDISSIPN